MFIYYVYAYINSNTGFPYYIGKGKNKRYLENHGRVTVPKDKKYIVFLEKNLSEIGALALERRYIEWYGRKNINTGILYNETAGGEGGDTSKSFAYQKARLEGKMNGAKYKTPEIKERERIKKSLALKGKKRPREVIIKMMNTRKERNIPSPNKGKNLSENHKNSLRKPKEKYICSCCNKNVGGKANLVRWHENNCKERVIK